MSAVDSAATLLHTEMRAAALRHLNIVSIETVFWEIITFFEEEKWTWWESNNAET